MGDIERVCHAQANLDLGIIIHLYRLSKPGAKISNRDWSSKSPRILTKEEVSSLLIREPVDVYYGLHDSTGKHEAGAWLISEAGITKLE